MSAVRVALVGLGGYGNGYVDAILDHGSAVGIELAGAIDPAPDGCRRRMEVAAITGVIDPDLETFYKRERADLVVVSAPIHLHAPFTVTALDHGSSVLCEKPVAGSREDALRMLQALHRAQSAANSSGRQPPILAIGYQWSFAAPIVRLKKQIAQGRFGTPLSLRTLVFWPRRRSYYARNSWAGKVRLPDGSWIHDSPVNNATAHYLHNMLFLLPEADAIPRTVTAELYRANQIESYDTAALRVETSGGAQLTFLTSHAVPAQTGPVIHYQFSDAEIYCTAPGSFFCRRPDGTVEELGSPDASHLEKLSRMAEAIGSGGQSPCTLVEASGQLTVALAAQESSQVTTLPTDLIRRTEISNGGSEADELLWIEPLPALFTQCFAQRLLPAELGSTEWAVAGQEVDTAALLLEPKAR